MEAFLQTVRDEGNQQTEEGKIANEGKIHNFFALAIAGIQIF